jgi:hypothetical protein
VPSSLCERLTPEQETLIRVISEPFIASGEWPIWQYVALMLGDQHGLDAASMRVSSGRRGQAPDVAELRTDLASSLLPAAEPWRQDRAA